MLHLCEIINQKTFLKFIRITQHYSSSREWRAVSLGVAECEIWIIAVPAVKLHSSKKERQSRRSRILFPRRPRAHVPTVISYIRPIKFLSEKPSGRSARKIGGRFVLRCCGSWTPVLWTSLATWLLSSIALKFRFVGFSRTIYEINSHV